MNIVLLLIFYLLQQIKAGHTCRANFIQPNCCHHDPWPDCKNYCFECYGSGSVSDGDLCTNPVSVCKNECFNDGGRPSSSGTTSSSISIMYNSGILEKTITASVCPALGSGCTLSEAGKSVRICGMVSSLDHLISYNDNQVSSSLSGSSIILNFKDNIVVTSIFSLSCYYGTGCTPATGAYLGYAPVTAEVYTCTLIPSPSTGIYINDPNADSGPLQDSNKATLTTNPTVNDSGGQSRCILSSPTFVQTDSSGNIGGSGLTFSGNQIFPIDTYTEAIYYYKVQVVVSNSDGYSQSFTYSSINQYTVKCGTLTILGPNISSTTINYPKGTGTDVYVMDHTSLATQDGAGTILTAYCPIKEYYANGLISTLTPIAYYIYQIPSCSNPGGLTLNCRTVTFSNTFINTYQISFLITAEGYVSKTTSQITIQIICDVGIDDPYSGEMSVTTYVDQGTIAGTTNTFELNQYSFISGNCLIQRYEVDNDNDPTTPQVQIDGVNGNTITTNCYLQADCRTATFDTDKVVIHNFWFQVYGENYKQKTSPEIIVYVGCHSQSFLPQSLTDLPGATNFTGFYYVGQKNSFVEYILEEYSMDEPSYFCDILSYKLNIDPSSAEGLQQKSTNCSTVDCRSVVIDSSLEKLYIFTFTVISDAKSGFNEYTTQKLRAQITCGAENQTISQQNLTYIYSSSTGLQVISFAEDGINSLFKTSIPACPITSYQIYESNITFNFWLGKGILLQDKLSPSLTQIHIDSSAGIRTKVYIYSFVQNFIALKRSTVGLELDITVCGLETLVDLVPLPIRYFRIQALQDEKIIISSITIKDYFRYNTGKSQDSCNNQTVDLYTDFNLTKRYQPPYSETNRTIFPLFVELNATISSNDTKSTQFMTIHNTHLVNYTKLFLGRITRGNVKARLELQFQVVEKEINFCEWCEQNLNYAPIFLSPIKENQQFDITTNINYLQYEIKLPDIDDDNNQFKMLEVKSDTVELGNATYNVDSGVIKNKTSVLQYDPNQNEIIIEFQSYQQMMSLNGTHIINIHIGDDRGEITKYKINLILLVPVKKITDTTFQMKKDINRPEGYLNAKITNLNAYGDLVIEFSHDVNTDYNISYLNSSISKLNSTLRNLTSIQDHFRDLMDIYVQPADNWTLYDENFTAETLNLTWTAVNFSGSILDIKIFFINPLEISPLTLQDLLIVEINPDQVFFKQEKATFAYLNENSTILSTRIPKQQRDTELLRQIDTATFVTQKNTLIIIAIQIVINTVFLGSLVYMASMINALQLIFNLPLMNFVFPANVMGYMIIMIPIVFFDFLNDLPWFADLFDTGDSQENQIRFQVQDLGYDTHNPILNLRSLTFFQLYYVVRIVFLYGVLYPLAYLPWNKYGKIFDPLQHFSWWPNKSYFIKKYKELKGTLIFSEILVIYFGSLLELLISGTIFMETPEDNPTNNWFNWVFSIYFISVPVLVIPAIFFWMFTQSLKQIKQQRFQRKWGILTNDLTLKSAGQATYYLIFCLRRIVFVALSIFFSAYPIFQVLGLNLMNLLVLIYITALQPFQGRFRNRIELFNDFSQINLCFHLMFFTDWVGEPDDQYRYGWQLIILTSLFMLVNMIIIISISLGYINLFMVKFYRLTQRWVMRQYEENLCKDRYSAKVILDGNNRYQVRLVKAQDLSKDKKKINIKKKQESVPNALKLSRNMFEKQLETSFKKSVITLDNIEDLFEQKQQFEKVQKEKEKLDSQISDQAQNQQPIQISQQISSSSKPKTGREAFEEYENSLIEKQNSVPTIKNSPATQFIEVPSKISFINPQFVTPNSSQASSRKINIAIDPKEYFGHEFYEKHVGPEERKFDKIKKSQSRVIKKVRNASILQNQTLNNINDKYDAIERQKMMKNTLNFEMM